MAALNPSQEPDPLLKYNIKNRLYDLPEDVFLHTFYMIVIRTKKNPQTVKNWMNIPYKSHSSIPVEAFYIIAEELGINQPDRLMNKPPLKKDLGGAGLVN